MGIIKAEWINGWTRKSFMGRVQKRNGFKRVSEASGGTCRYRLKSEDGPTLCCMAGSFIDDNDYISDMEGQAIRVILNRYASIKMPLDLVSMSDLQAIHDSTALAGLMGGEFEIDLGDSPTLKACIEAYLDKFVA